MLDPIPKAATRAMPLLGLVMAGAAAAQPLSDVVVSASRNEQRSFDAPAAIQSIDEATIREAGPQVNLSESLTRVPGVSILNRQNYAQDLQLSIRGFGARSTFGIRGLRLVVDGIPATIPDGQGQASTISLPSASRIEVLRGPHAQLYGNAAGGVVQVFSRDGPKTPEAGLDFWAGSFGLRRIGLNAGGEYGALNAMVDYSRMSIDGYRQHASAERNQFNTKLRYALDERTDFTLVANVFDQPMSKDAAGLTRQQWQADPRQAGTNAILQNAGKEVSQNQFGLVARHAFDADRRLSAHVYTGQRDLSNRLTIPLAAQQANTAAGGIVKLDRSYSGMGLQYSQRVALPVGTVLATAGFDNDRASDRRRGFLNNAGVQGALKRDEDNLFTSTGYFVQADWAIDADWTLTGGLRHSRVRFEVRDFFVNAGTPVNGDDSGARTFSATNPVLGVTRHLSESTNVYFNVGRGFETPTFAEFSYTPTTSGPNFGLAASRSTHLELGYKSRIGDAHRIDAALFSIGTDDEIVVDTNTGGRSTFRNAGRTSRRGLELAYAGNYAGDLSTRWALTLMKATFEDGFGSGAAAVAAGNELPGTPSRFVFGELAWRPKLSGALQGFSTAVEVVHSSSLWVNDANSDRTPSYTIFNWRAGLEQRVGNWRLREFVRLDNLGDRSYVGSVIVNEANARYFEPAPGRSFLVGLSASYAWR